MASCQLVTPSAWRWRWPSRSAACIWSASASGRTPASRRHRALVQHAGRVPAVVPLDVPVRGVVGAGGDAGDLERPGVDPHPVVVAVGQRDRPVGHDLVQLGGGRQATGEGGHRPAAALDPGEVGVRGGMLADVREIGTTIGRQPAQVAAEPLEAALHRVDVGVGEAGQEQSARGVHDGGAPRRDVLADGGDPAIAHDDVTDPPAVDRAVEDRCVAEDRGAHPAILHRPRCATFEHHVDDLGHGPRAGASHASPRRACTWSRPSAAASGTWRPSRCCSCGCWA